MLMCREATRLMSLKLDRKLTFKERTALRLHLSICSACRGCARQFDLLHRIGSRHPAAPTQPGEEQNGP